MHASISGCYYDPMLCIQYVYGMLCIVVLNAIVFKKSGEFVGISTRSMYTIVCISFIPYVSNQSCFFLLLL